jgi:hypothetical protein
MTRDAAKANSLRLLEADKVDVIIGGSTTGTTVFLLPRLAAPTPPALVDFRPGAD